MKSKKTTSIQVRHFTDYRAFLLAHSQDMKKRNSKWSYGMWAKALDLKSTSSLTKIIQGERHPGHGITEKMVKYFYFQSKDAQYFRDLIRLHKIKKDPRLALALMEKMEKSYPSGSFRIIDGNSFSIISNWYCYAIREMTRLNDFFEDPEWISKKFLFRVTPREIQKAINQLEELNLLKRDKNNVLMIADGRIDTTNDIASEGIKRYHEQMLENAKMSIRKTSVEKREFTGASLVINNSNLNKAKEFIREFRRKFAEIFEEKKGDGLYHIQIQLFPLINTCKLNNKKEKK